MVRSGTHLFFVLKIDADSCSPGNYPISTKLFFSPRSRFKLYFSYPPRNWLPSQRWKRDSTQLTNATSSTRGGFMCAPVISSILRKITCWFLSFFKLDKLMMLTNPFPLHRIQRFVEKLFRIFLRVYVTNLSSLKQSTEGKECTFMFCKDILYLKTLPEEKDLLGANCLVQWHKSTPS